MEKLPPPNHFEPEYLYTKYELLRKAVYNMYKDSMKNATDREDLRSQIDIYFLELVNEYDPNLGVDFPYYIKKMLNFRMYPYITAYNNQRNKEQFASAEEEEFIIEDDSYEEVFQRIIDLNSLNPNMVLGKKHRKLMEGLIIEGKTLQQLADEEGVPVSRIHARLYFLIKKFREEYEKEKGKHGNEDLY